MRFMTIWRMIPLFVSFNFGISWNNIRIWSSTVYYIFITVLWLYRLEALNVAWTNMSRGALLYLVICLPPSLTKLNLSGCRESLLDEGTKNIVINVL